MLDTPESRLFLVPSSIYLAFPHGRVNFYLSTVCQGISGVLVRLTTCKSVTNSLPKPTLITLSPAETAG